MRGSFRFTFLLRSLLIACAAFLSLHSGAQFTINGRLKIDGGDINGARLVVYRNGQKERTVTTNLNKFSMDLQLNSNYILSFEKDGFVSKKLSFNTSVPPEAAATQFTPFDYAVSLFKQYDDLNMIVFNQPVGIIRYEPSMGDFDYDTDYTRSIQSQLQQALDAVAQKQKEEAENAAAEARRKAAEEKELAKKNEEAAKLAAAKAKADAEAAKLAEAKAKADAEALTKAEAKARAEEKAKTEALAREQAKKAEGTKLAETPKKEKVETKVPPKAPAPIAPVAAVQQAPIRKQVTIKERVNGPTLAQMNSGGDQRRSTSVITHQEERPAVESVPIGTDRKEELFVEPNKVTTVVQITAGDVVTEYRKVIHKWGSTFYFKNGEACTQLIYEKEAYGESLAGATPRGKFD